MSNATDRFLSRKWGVMNHYLNGMQNGNLKDRNPTAKITDWNTCVNEFDTEKLAYNLHKMGAGYYLFTLMQGTKYICAPNATFDKYAGTNPGEACSLRDLPADLIKAFKKYDIDLFLYYTGDGPHLSTDLKPDLQLGNPRGTVTQEYVEKWTEVLHEFSERYGTDVKGWWIDGAYRWLGLTDEYLAYFHRAIKAGNPDAVTAFNVLGTGRYGKGFAGEEYVAGERNDFDMYPIERLTDGKQSHILAPLGILPENMGGGAWAYGGCKRNREYMLNYIKGANAAGAPVTVDIVVYRDGSFDKEQQELLEWVGQRL
ncbi:MAG: alpha-L-fucosidase [Clostridia bacterium]|nr:alpha-L-fucosidase [Clostridia bacterium]